MCYRYVIIIYMIDSRIFDILCHYRDGLTIRLIIDKLLPDIHEYNDISIICHNMVNREILIKERNEHEIFIYRIADMKTINITPPDKGSNIKVTNYMD
jgi:hypothetical protein